MAINPLGPQPGQSPSEVVKGFLDAMQATPDPHRRGPGVPRRAVQGRLGPRGDGHLRHRVPPAAQPGGGQPGRRHAHRRGPDRRARLVAGRGHGDDDLHFTVVQEDGRVPDRRSAGHADRPAELVRAAVPPGPALLLRPDLAGAGPRPGLRAAQRRPRLDTGPAADRRPGARPRRLLAQRCSRRAPTPRSRSRSRTTASPRSTSSATSRCPGSLDRGLLVAQLAWTLRQVPSVAQPERVRRRGAGHARRPARGQRDDGRGVRPVRRGRQQAPLRSRGRADGRGQRAEPGRGRRAVRPGRPRPAVDHAGPRARRGPRGSPRTARRSTSAPSAPPPSRRRSRRSSPGPPTCWSRPGTSPTGSGWSTAGRKAPS